MPKNFHVFLSDEQRQQLTHFISSGNASARKLTRARILLKADSSPQGPAWSDPQIAEALETSPETVARVRKEFAKSGLDATVTPKHPKRIYKKVIDGRAEATLIATACSEPPPGHSHWTLRLLADKLVELQVCESVSYESVRRVMKKKRAQAVARRGVGHSPGPEQRLRGRHGRGSGDL